jgi:hypothetical protein
VLAVVLFAILIPKTAAAFPWMIRHEYTACATCHVDPSGASAMTPYGRAQSEILLRSTYGVPVDDEGRLGAFAFGAVRLPEELILQGDVRLLRLWTKPPSPAPTVGRTILMQADATAAISTERFRGAATIGYVHEGALAASVTHGERDRIVSRRHWAGVTFGEGEAFLLRGGRMDLPFGLRILEHTSFVRSETRTDINAAQQHGISLAYGDDQLRGELMAIVGNLQIAPSAFRERGYAGYLEYAPTTSLAVGASSMVTHADRDLATAFATFRQAHGLFGRWSPARPLVLLLEADVLVRSPKGRALDVGAVGFLQADLEVLRGLHFALTGEALERSFGAAATAWGAWFTTAWFFAPHADLRVDLVARDLAAGDARASVLSALVQVHAFL